MINKIDFFASANTGIGFVNNFKYINTSDEHYNFILKGGSGTGKSTLMKKIGKYFEDRGKKIEYFYCSSDSDSLDAVHIVDNDIAIIDGTAPHITEASIPKVDSEIVNLGEYIGDDLKKNSKQIKKLVNKKSELYSLFYKHLKVIKDIEDIIDFNNDKCGDYNTHCLQILNGLQLKEKDEIGINRNLFCKCFTPNGVKILDYERLNTIKIDLDSVILSNTLKKLATQINYLGYQTISILNIINPNKIEGLIIRELDILLIGKKQVFGGLKRQLKVDLNIEIMRACEVMSDIRKVHTKLENYYIKHLDIDGLNCEYKKLLCKIINMTK